MNGYVWAILLYAVLLMGVGFFITRRVKGSADFFVGGRKFGPALLFITMVAPNIGAGSTVGVAGLGYKVGISAAWWVAASAMGTFVLAFIVGPAIWRLAKEHNFYTLGDYLDYRYNKNFRGLISLMMAIGTLAIFAGQLMGIAWILSVVAGVTKPVGILLGAVVVVVYFGAGGLLSAAYVNIIEATVKLLGFAVAVPFVLSFVGGWSGLEAKIAANMGDAAKTADFFAFDGVGMTTIMGFFLMLTPSFFISPGLIGKVYGARDRKTVVVGTFLCGLVMLAFAVIPAIFGMAAAAINPGLTERELALPYVMKECMPFWASALALAAIFSAEVSAADAVLYMITSSFTKDIYKTFIKPDISDEKLLKSGRIVAVVAGGIGIGLAILLPNIITALTIFYSLMSVSLTAPLLFGLFSRRPSSTAAFISAIAGIITTVSLQFGNAGKGLGVLNAQSTAILLTMVIMIIMMYVFPAQKKASSNEDPGDIAGIAFLGGVVMEEKIRKVLAEIKEQEVVDFTCQLVRVPSVVRARIEDGNEEQVALLIAEKLKAMGLKVTVDFVAPHRPNVIAVYSGRLPGKCLLFEGHTDVVTEGAAEDWEYPPFAAQVAEDRIYGRGSCDTKGNVAAMIMAVKAIIESGVEFSGKIVLCFPVDEEGMMQGIKHFIRQGWADGVDGAIICEPEENNLCITQKGAMRAVIKTEGKMSHGCMPLAGINPITRLARLIIALDEFEKQEKARLGMHPLLGYPSITPTILASPVQGEPQINVVPKEAMVALDIRTVPGQEHTVIKEKIAAIFATLQGADPHFRATLDVIEERPWTQIAKDDPLVVAMAEAYEKLTGKTVIYNGVPGATDGTFLSAWKNIPVAATGAGNRLIPHQQDEYVEVAELVETTKWFASAALRFLK